MQSNFIPLFSYADLCIAHGKHTQIVKQASRLLIMLYKEYLQKDVLKKEITCKPNSCW